MASVDVFIPCYRYADYLRRCVESVLSQSVGELRVLILDDCSPDHTPEVAAALMQEDPRVSYRRHVVNQGHIATFNEGLEWASADYVMLLSADDHLLPNALALEVELMERHPEVGFVFGNYVTLDDDGTEILHRLPFTGGRRAGERARILPGLEFIEANGSRNLVRTPTVLVRNALHRRVGGYLPELPHSGDMELWMRLAARSSVGFVDESVAVYRVHSARMSATEFALGSFADLEQRKAAIECFLRSSDSVLPSGHGLDRKLFGSLARDAVKLASGAFNEGNAELASRFCEFARAIAPGVERSLTWRLLAVKRSLGLRTWRFVQPMVGRVRRLVQHS